MRTRAQAGILCDALNKRFWFDRVKSLRPAPQPIKAQRVNASSASFSNPASWKRITGSVLFPRLLETWMVGSVERKDIIAGGRKQHRTKKTLSVDHLIASFLFYVTWWKYAIDGDRFTPRGRGKWKGVWIFIPGVGGASARATPRDGSRVLLVLACARGQRKSRISHLIIARFSVRNAFPLIILIYDSVIFWLH